MLRTNNPATVAPRIWMTWGDNPCEADFLEMGPPRPAGSEDRIVRYAW